MICDLSLGNQHTHSHSNAVDVPEDVHDHAAASIQICKTVTVSFTNRCKAPYLKILKSAGSPKESLASLSILVLCDKNQT